MWDCAPQQPISHDDEGTGNSIQKLEAKLMQRSGMKELPCCRAPSVHSGDAEDTFFGIKWTLHKERTVDNLKRSLEIEISFAKNQNTSAICVKGQTFQSDQL